MRAHLFYLTQCERCSEPASVRLMSYFVEEMICADCHAAETRTLSELRAEGRNVRALANCGYLPRANAPAGPDLPKR